MYFSNENHKAVTGQDTMFLRQVCILLRTLLHITHTQRTTNPKWSIVQMECHSIARLVSLVFKELTVVDGFIIGLQLVPGETSVTLVHTCHSWLRTPDGAIIDPYPMGVIATTSALLIPTSNTQYCAHGGNLYHESLDVREHFSEAKCWRNARSSLQELKKHAPKENIEAIAASII